MKRLKKTIFLYSTTQCLQITNKNLSYKFTVKCVYNEMLLCCQSQSIKEKKMVEFVSLLDKQQTDNYIKSCRFIVYLI